MRKDFANLCKKTKIAQWLFLLCEDYSSINQLLCLIEEKQFFKLYREFYVEFEK